MKLTQNRLQLSSIPDQDTVKKKQIFISWTKYQRRVESMKKFMDFKVYYFGQNSHIVIFKYLFYLQKSFKTLVTFMKEKPEVIWIQLPPTFIIYPTYFYFLLRRKKPIVLADCHNAQLRKPWLNFPFFNWIINQFDQVVVHNDFIKSVALESGFCRNKLTTLETRPAILEESDHEVSSEEKKYILAPCSFNLDEPVEVMFEAMKLADSVNFIVTGDISRFRDHKKIEVPENVTLTGYISSKKFDDLLVNCTGVLGLTIFEGIQLSVANEAVGASKPMVISNTKTLRSLFYKGAVYVDTNSAESIAKGCEEIIHYSRVYEQEVKELKNERISRWEQQASKILELTR